MAGNSSDQRAEGPLDRLKSEAADLVGAVGDRTFSSLRDKVEDATERLTEYTKGAASPGVKAAVSGGKSLAQGKGPVSSVVRAGATAVKEKAGNMFGKGGDGKGGGDGANTKVTNIVESIDVGVPIKLAYDQWTRFTDFPSFMKKVENVEQEEDQKLQWRAQVLWSHRTWESTILEQVPEDKIVWRSQGDKGYVDGAVTFHEVTPNLTRILVTLAYHPKGFFEHVGNIWRAQGRRVRLELKHFQRQVMTESLLHPDEVDGWRGRISDGKVQDQGKRQSARGKGRTKDEADGKGSSRTRRTSTAARTSTASRAGTGSRRSASTTSSGRSARSGSSRSSGSSGSSRSSASSGSSGNSGNSDSTTARSRSAAGNGTSRPKSRQATSRSKKAADS